LDKQQEESTNNENAEKQKRSEGKRKKGKKMTVRLSQGCQIVEGNGEMLTPSKRQRKKIARKHP